MVASLLVLSNGTFFNTLSILSLYSYKMKVITYAYTELKQVMDTSYDVLNEIRISELPPLHNSQFIGLSAVSKICYLSVTRS